MLNNQYWVVIPAAGIGTRMEADCPKQYLTIHAKPILQHTIERFDFPMIAGIVVSLAKQDTYWEKLTLNINVPLFIAEGGKERYHSVFNSLLALKNRARPDDWVLVHDAARPCVRQSDVQNLMQQLSIHPVGGLLGIPVRDTLKRTNAHNHVTETVNREGLWHALTPQMFRYDLLYKALSVIIATHEMITDDAQAMEKLGYTPVFIEGHADNIKITRPQDLALATLYLQALAL
ncbi:2-C-methyl-D-erythritol 4-phosphate cytidylyltransferase [Beggiatoa leptomitoformis]|uniref:2-C-methyl-D-erythritol 4-phosphate cytidylyltransferase n=1 Tax=Beggiatoa leptomitoformis TaxID=288004 RepID=A0A2N9YIA2_9GAMM|nr:2-C-methyl-D-erythritol 4-phosphate cytidylyltransferase [Beggiatoa leptomitoformis]ALG69380.2 2-C-methyl-D-erythritol 4-phosphate cytidylyltransferase [Beggiatoa leptomitoformis]AUI70262.1 2-C-methyl-D-erythritol 4-phosphate cytidylyltransferase [Beggiatoa leptomitoformis]